MEVRDMLSLSSRSLYWNIALSFRVWCTLSQSLGTFYLSHTALVQSFYPKSISRSRSKSREIIAGKRLYAGGSNYNWLRESDNGRLLSSNFIRELSLPRIIYNGLISYNQV